MNMMIGAKIKCINGM